MTPSRRAVRHELDNLLSYLLASEIALLTTPVLDEPQRLGWRPFAKGSKFLEIRDPPTLAGYRSWLEAGQYSALLYEGSLLQISYDFAGSVMTRHRLAWIPCPFAIEPELLELAPLLEVLDLYAGGAPQDVVLHTPIRFDFDLERATRDHPAAHMTINASHCRIACTAPLALGYFVDFVFRNFYPDHWKVHPYLERVSRKAWGEPTVTEQERTRLHIAWAR